MPHTETTKNTKSNCHIHFIKIISEKNIYFFRDILELHQISII